MAQNSGIFNLHQQGQSLTSGQWVTDPYFKNTSALFQADSGLNGAQNQTFRDTSITASAITVNGDVNQGTFSPFSQPNGYWSNYFGGSGNYYISNSAVFANTATTFTVEGWIFMTAAAVSASNMPSVIGDMQPASTANYWSFGPLASGALSFYWYDGGAKSATSAGTVPLNTWTHIAVSVNANAISLFINGVQQTLSGTTTLTNRSGSNSYVAFGQFNSASSLFTGYVSNFSVLSGTAKYSGNFTPSATPLATGTTNQVLLCGYSNGFADSNTATTAKTFTLTGTPSVQTFSPFTPQSTYTTSQTGGSGYFDGSTDYLSLPYTSALQFTGDFTIEFWVYPVTQTSSAPCIVNNYSSWPSSTGFSIFCGHVSGSATKWNVALFGSFPAITSTNDYIKNAWSHIALVRNGSGSNNITLYVNGVASGTATSNSTVTGTGDNWWVGAAGDSLGGVTYAGNITDLRASALAVYTGAFTPPTAPLTTTTGGTVPPSSAQTKLLLNMTNAGIIDSTAKNDITTTGNAQVATLNYKFGAGSIFFDGNGDYTYTAASPTNSLGSGDWTVECWINPSAYADAMFIDFRSGGASTGPTFGINTSGNLVMQVTGTTIFTGPVVPLGTWTHIAFVKTLNRTYVFANGIRYNTSYADTNSYYTPARVFLGADDDGSSNAYFTGYLDDVRVTKGLARYIEDFTPPKAAFAKQ